MTRKQMKKFAREIYECELIHENPSSSKEEKSRAEDKIMQLTNQIMTSRNGLDIMSEIDTIIQNLLNSKEK